jgi:hypothetical protein
MELRADVSFHTDVAVYARESTMLYGVMIFMCEDLYVNGHRLRISNCIKYIGDDT